MFGGDQLALALVLLADQLFDLGHSMSSSADSAPTYMMFLNSWRWRGSLYSRLQISVSGTPTTLMSSRNFDGRHRLR